MLKADVSGSLEALQDEIAKLPQERDRGRRHPLGARRDHRVRRHARRRVRRDHHRLQRPPAGRGAKGGRARGRRDPHLLGDLQGHRGDLRARSRDARARGGRGDDRRRPRSRSCSGPRASATIAGCLVTDGKITRTAQVRLVREGTVVWTGRIGSLRRFKDNVRRSRRASSAASSSRATRTSRSATCWRSSRPSRSSRRWSRAGPADDPYVCLIEVRSPQRLARPEGQAQGPPLAEGPGSSAIRGLGGRGRRAGHLAAGDARVRAGRRLARSTGAPTSWSGSSSLVVRTGAASSETC